MTTQYVRRGIVTKTLGIHYQTLYRMEDRGEIDVVRAKNGHRRYNLSKYLSERNLKIKDGNISNNRVNICYCRVSSAKQKKDLKRQVELMKSKYPRHRVIEDIGSGLNMNRKGLRYLIDLAIKGDLAEVVVSYRDRLCRFGYDMLSWIITTYSHGHITVLHKSEEETPEEEITRDILQIMNVYVAKINGRRSKKNTKKVIKKD